MVAVAIIITIVIIVIHHHSTSSSFSSSYYYYYYYYYSPNTPLSQGASARDTVLQAGALRPLVKCIQRNVDSQQVSRIGSWAINNICGGQVSSSSSSSV